LAVTSTRFTPNAISENCKMIWTTTAMRATCPIGVMSPNPAVDTVVTVK